MNTNPTPDQLRICIAEACGWKRFPRADDTEFDPPRWVDPTGEMTHTLVSMPDYAGSLDAMHTAESTLDPKQAHEMERVLQRIVFKEGNTDENWATGDGSIKTLMFHASAHQRALAFVRALKLEPKE